MLKVVATPIGHLGDLSERAVQTLLEAENWIVEDTRVSAKLKSHIGAKPSMHVLNDHTSQGGIQRLADSVLQGGNWALLSDAGVPAISDPGSQLVDILLDQGVEVTPIPGPSAVTTALSVSGFFAQRYTFLGYLPRKDGEIKSLLAPYKDSTLTLVWFESPHRFRKSLAAASEALGDRRYAICRELTKKNEQVFRGSLPSIPLETEVFSKGEFTIVVEGLRKSPKRNQPIV